MPVEATIIPFPRRVRSAPDATQAPVLPAPGLQDGGNTFTRLRTRSGRDEWLTPWGRAYRIGGRWFVGIPARLITVPETIALLDAAERGAR